MIKMQAQDSEEMLRALIDACWDAGIRPTGFDDFRRQNDAKDAHLQDMRTLVAKAFDANLKD